MTGRNSKAPSPDPSIADLASPVTTKRSLDGVVTGGTKGPRLSSARMGTVEGRCRALDGREAAGAREENRTPDLLITSEPRPDNGDDHGRTRQVSAGARTTVDTPGRTRTRDERAMDAPIRPARMVAWRERRACPRARVASSQFQPTNPTHGAEGVIDPPEIFGGDGEREADGHCDVDGRRGR